ncbi:MAG: tetratricopeptide repeat protein [Spirochaetaceae bacterium]
MSDIGRMRRSALFAILTAFLSSLGFAWAQEADRGFSVAPLLLSPLGENRRFFETGGLAELELYSSLAGAEWVRPALRAGYGYTPVGFDSSVSLLSVGAGAGVRTDLTERLGVQLTGAGGYYFGSMNDASGVSSGGALADGRLSALFRISRRFGLSVEAGYREHFGLGGFLVAGLAGTFRFAAPTAGPPETIMPAPRPLEEAAGATPLTVSDARFQEIFPVFFKYYDEHPIGVARLENVGKEEIADLAVTFTVGRYMDGPTSCRVPRTLLPGATGEVEILGFFNDSVLDITEATKVAGELEVSFTVDEQQYIHTYTRTLRLHDRNSMTWDDDRKPAAYVTAREPVVMSLAKEASNAATADATTPIPLTFRTAMALHTAVMVHGTAYTPDPASPFRNRDSETLEIDYLQFPRQTLEYRGGDCDDLSILYSALLESVGIESAFILVPGHILAAFNLEMHPTEARRQFPNSDDLIFRGNETWVPVETTELSGGFLAAWNSGARTWRRASAEERVTLLTVSEAWELFEPVGLLGPGKQLPLPDSEAIGEQYRRILRTFIHQTVTPMVAELEERALRSADPLRLHNRIAVLYGRYGLYEEAGKKLEEILASDSEFVPALTNWGNIYCLTGEPEKAAKLYGRALELDPDNPAIMLSYAQVSHQADEHAVATRMLERARQIDPDLAGRFAYIDSRGREGTRASGAGNEVILWEE